MTESGQSFFYARVHENLTKPILHQIGSITEFGTFSDLSVLQRRIWITALFVMKSLCVVSWSW